MDDAAQVGPLLDQVTGLLTSVTADGAYDQDGVYDAIAERHRDTAVIVPPRRTVVLSDEAAIAPTQRDRHLQCIAETSRRAWQQASGYNKRAKVEMVCLQTLNFA
jgi:transposase